MLECLPRWLPVKINSHIACSLPSILLNDVLTVHRLCTHSPSALEARQHHLFLGDLVHPKTEIRSYNSLSNFFPCLLRFRAIQWQSNSKQQTTTKTKCYSIALKFSAFAQAEDSLLERLTHWTWYPKPWAQIFRYDDYVNFCLWFNNTCNQLT